MRIDDVARNSAKVVNGIGLAADMARALVTVSGGTYMAAVNQSFEVRSAAIDAMDASRERTFSLTRNEAEAAPRRRRRRPRPPRPTTSPAPPPLLATAPAPAPAPAAASVAPAVQLAHMKAVAEATALELERNRVGRDKFASGKFGATKSARCTALERRLESPQEWLDENSKGNFSKFEISALVVLEHGSKAGAARFVEGRDRAIAVGSTYGGKGMNFQALPRSGVKFQYPIAYANVVAACFGKASMFVDGQATTKKSHSGVAVVTLLLAHQAKLQVISFQLSKHEEDKNLCKMLMNQKDGIAKMVPAKHAEATSRFWDKFVGAKMLDDDEGELFEADIVGISWYEGQKEEIALRAWENAIDFGSSSAGLSIYLVAAVTESRLRDIGKCIFLVVLCFTVQCVLLVSITCEFIEGPATIVAPCF
ncbi:hypothetical protein JL721_8464 [Aureococcus anophagefferens]|nr:hypothetical protein JL721_8464 [Aureococcus anophagefferens]